MYKKVPPDVEKYLPMYLVNVSIHEANLSTKKPAPLGKTQRPNLANKQRFQMAHGKPRSSRSDRVGTVETSKYSLEQPRWNAKTPIGSVVSVGSQQSTHSLRIPTC